VAQLIPGPAFRPHGAYEALRANSRSMRSLSKLPERLLRFELADEVGDPAGDGVVGRA
jgi:hypothetical protein